MELWRGQTRLKCGIPKLVSPLAVCSKHLGEDCCSRTWSYFAIWRGSDPFRFYRCSALQKMWWWLGALTTAQVGKSPEHLGRLLLSGLLFSTPAQYPPRNYSLKFPGMLALGRAALRKPSLVVKLLTNNKKTKVNTGTGNWNGPNCMSSEKPSCGLSWVYCSPRLLQTRPFHL